MLRAYDGGERLTALAYYELCLCAHWATAGSFVPTDVDNGIRWKLWQDCQPGLTEEQAKLVLDVMKKEAAREDEAFVAIVKAGDALEILRASALIAHNFGDLSRVADQWELKPHDPLRAALYDAAKPGSPLFGGRLGRAGELNKKHMSADNHRHYPLRAATTFLEWFNRY